MIVSAFINAEILPVLDSKIYGERTDREVGREGEKEMGEVDREVEKKLKEVDKGGEKLKEKSYLRREGTAKGGYWKLLKNIEIDQPKSNVKV